MMCGKTYFITYFVHKNIQTASHDTNLVKYASYRRLKKSSFCSSHLMTLCGCCLVTFRSQLLNKILQQPPNYILKVH